MLERFVDGGQELVLSVKLFSFEEFPSEKFSSPKKNFQFLQKSEIGDCL